MGKHNIKKDKKTRFFLKQKELKRIVLKYNLNSKFIKKKYKLIFFYKFIKNFHLNSSTSRLVNTCIYTGRSYWILRKFRLSRMSFRKLADQGLFNGVRRASW